MLANPLEYFIFYKNKEYIKFKKNFSQKIKMCQEPSDFMQLLKDTLNIPNRQILRHIPLSLSQ